MNQIHQMNTNEYGEETSRNRGGKERMRVTDMVFNIHTIFTLSVQDSNGRWGGGGHLYMRQKSTCLTLHDFDELL